MKTLYHNFSITKMSIMICLFFSLSLFSQSQLAYNEALAKDWKYLGEFLNDNTIEKNETRITSFTLRTDQSMHLNSHQGTWSLNPESDALEFKIHLEENKNILPIDLYIVHIEDSILIVSHTEIPFMHAIYVPKDHLVDDATLQETVDKIIANKKTTKDNQPYLGYTPRGHVLHSIKFNTTTEIQNNNIEKYFDEGIIYLVWYNGHAKLVVVRSTDIAPLEWDILDRETYTGNFIQKASRQTKYDYDLHEHLGILNTVDIHHSDNQITVNMPLENKSITFHSE